MNTKSDVKALDNKPGENILAVMVKTDLYQTLKYIATNVIGIDEINATVERQITNNN